VNIHSSVTFLLPADKQANMEQKMAACVSNCLLRMRLQGHICKIVNLHPLKKF